MPPNIQVNEEPAVDPICPHCEKTIQQLGARRIQSTLGVRYLYYCLGCRKVLGVSHRKGFWMG